MFSISILFNNFIKILYAIYDCCVKYFKRRWWPDFVVSILVTTFVKQTLAKALIKLTPVGYLHVQEWLSNLEQLRNKSTSARRVHFQDLWIVWADHSASLPPSTSCIWITLLSIGKMHSVDFIIKCRYMYTLTLYFPGVFFVGGSSISSSELSASDSSAVDS